MEIFVDRLDLWREFQSVALICVLSINLTFFPFWIGFIGAPIIEFSFFREAIVAFIVAVYIVLYVLAVWVLSKRAEDVSNARNTLKRLQLMYIEVLLVFASLYYFFAVYSGENHPFQGSAVSHDLDLLNTTGLLSEYLKYLYFSVVTGTTLGFGEITPASGMTRFLVVSQVLLQLYIVVVGVGPPLPA